MKAEKIWKVKPRSAHARTLAGEAGITPLQAQLLINRGISDPGQAVNFLHPRLSSMTDPMLLKDMDKALELVIGAVHHREKITIYGDYDADGLTAAALLVNFFSSLDVPVSYYIPHRLKEGYGLNGPAIKKIAATGTELLITVDCGSGAAREVSLAKSLGMKVVVTDHHQIPEGFHALCPVINPHRPDCPFPFKEQAGAGVAFFLAVAVRAGLRRTGWFNRGPEPDLRGYLDMVALGTTADRVPLLGQNRILVKAGLQVMASTRWPGIKAMQETAGLGGPAISTDDLAYRLGPRLNAPGRMEGPEVGIEMLTVEDLSRARYLSGQADLANKRRQDVERGMIEQIEGMIRTEAAMGRQKSLVVAREGWHKGVLGIVASKLVEKYHRPVLVLNVGDGVAVGSGRSIDGFNLYGALRSMGHLFEKFGGHAHAAGFTLKAERVALLREELEGLAGRVLTDEDLVPGIDVDGEIFLEDLDLNTLNQLEALSPFGEGNPEPLFVARSLRVLESRVVGEGHLKMVVRQGRKTLEAIAFKMGDKHPLQGKVLHMVFSPEINRWQGQERIQLKIADLRESEA